MQNPLNVFKKFPFNIALLEHIFLYLPKSNKSWKALPHDKGVFFNQGNISWICLRYLPYRKKKKKNCFTVLGPGILPSRVMKMKIRLPCCHISSTLMKMSGKGGRSFPASLDQGKCEYAYIFILVFLFQEDLSTGIFNLFLVLYIVKFIY